MEPTYYADDYDKEHVAELMACYAAEKAQIEREKRIRAEAEAVAGGR